MAERLGELLVRKNMIKPEQLQAALREQKASGGRLGTALTKLGLVEENELTKILSEQYGIPSINLDEIDIPGDALELIPQDVAMKYQVIPVNRAGSTLVVAAADPTNVGTIDAIRFKTDLDVDIVIASEGAIKRAIDRYYDSSSSLQEVMARMDEDIDVVEDEKELSISELEKASGDAPVIKLVNSILTDAIKKKASDIHVEPFEDEFRVRFRIDGLLYEVTKLPVKFKNAVTSRIKIMSKLDISERRLPQDGRIKLKISKGQEMDFRVSVLPSLFGEKVVMRLLDKSNLQLDMTKLGFEEKALADFKNSIHQPFGMVLVTGPTGSGKTTTLYSALSELNKISENISTAEDPVEFNLKGITQVHMNEDIGLNFAAALRSFLRQDPDIIMVGEIRDFETAEIAVKAALTGHMVLSTLHTNDAPSTINRLLNMGIEPFLVSSSLNCIVAQRLARRICTNCRQVIEVPVQALVEIGINEEEAKSITCYKGAGCNICHDTGYKGRVALYEVMVVRDEIKEFILNGASAAELKREAISLGMKTLRRSGITKLKEGVTTVEEVIRTSVAD
ncbi:MAG: type IV-A pilus assembly ATPase PilB [Deltaproteobacteria bacterium]|nr:MAG: type IV-A pilus assembly ATPase PilB [Deltaproteobacteria bacterium]